MWVGGRRIIAVDRSALGTVFVDDLAEVAVDGGRRRYRACPADKAAVRRQRRPRPSKITSCDRLCKVVEAKLELRWSPQQISGWLVEEFPDDPEMRVSHETLYVSLSSNPVARHARN